MATRNNIAVNAIAREDLRLKQYAFGKQVAGGIDVCDTLGEKSQGVIGNTPNTGGAVEWQQGPHDLVKVGAVAVADGAELTPDANGFARTAVSTNNVTHLASEAGAVGAVIRALRVSAYAKA